MQTSSGCYTKLSRAAFSVSQSMPLISIKIAENGVSGVFIGRILNQHREQIKLKKKSNCFQPSNLKLGNSQFLVQEVSMHLQSLFKPCEQLWFVNKTPVLILLSLFSFLLLSFFIVLFFLPLTPTLR